jgi:hypothetical protein
MNIVPSAQIFETGNYFCTWATQGTWFPPKPGENTDDTGCRYTRNGINARYLFANDGALEEIPKDIRGDLIVVIDDGWDVPYDTKNPENIRAFGACMPDAERFPGMGETPEARLFGLSERVKRLGFRGLGLWIAVQVPGEDRDSQLSLEAFTERWEKNARLCGEAGIAYWKVDWGRHANTFEFRNALSEAVRKYAPALLIEHSYVSSPMSESPEERNTDKFKEKLETIKKTLQVSDFFRTYDVMYELDAPSTLIRLRDLFAEHDALRPDGHRHIPNVEYLCMLGAALGCSVGVMQHPARSKASEFEIRRALSWYRIAPPFAIEKTPVFVSEEELTDAWTFEGDPSVWPHYGGQTKTQTAPARISRNAPLPEVRAESGLLPYVVCALNPFTCCFSVAALPRTQVGSLKRSAPADVTAFAGKPDCPVGVFGDYSSLTIVFDGSVNGKKVFAQDLAGKHAEDVTGCVSIKENRLVLPGGLISKIGKSASPEGPAGMALKLL